jgi:hypothetical protein
MTIFLVTLAVLLIGIALISVRILLVPGGQFHGTCASRNVTRDEQDKGCICGRKPGEACPNDESPDASREPHDASSRHTTSVEPRS